MVVDTKVSTVLKLTKKRIEKPEHWARHELAKNKKGETVPCSSKQAYAFCTTGSLQRTTKGFNYPYDDCMKILQKVFGGNFIGDRQDVLTHEQVMAKLDEAIEIAIEEEKNE